LIAKFESIKSRRIVLKDDWHMFIHAPSERFMSLPAVAMVGSLVDRSDRIYRSIDESTLPEEDVALIWCSDYILSPREVPVFERLSNSRRKREWLLGRIAAKDAIRLLVSELTGLRLSCGDIEIGSDQFGAPTAVVPQFSSGSKLTVSITHKDGLAIAVAGYSANRIGIDLEKIEAREVGLEKLLFSEGEQALLNKWIESNRDLNLSIAWAAKEAAAKAIGSGLKGDPKSLEIVAVDGVGERQRLSLRLRGSQSSIMTVFAQATEKYVLTECELATAAMA
jgi:4'-phosphopantetheinyl transferase EntD